MSEPALDPVIVMCHARSGSTLLSYVLNANPTLYCPSETGLAPNLLAMAKWVAEISRDAGDAPGTELLGEDQVALIRSFVGALYADRLRAEQASRWCDKSLGTHVASDLLAKIFPRAQYICLFRNFPDFAASALEACPFGLRNYGFDSYAQETPGNAIFSLARYWVDHVQALLTFQDSHPESCLTLSYESLVRNFRPTIEKLGSFLDAPWSDQSISSEAVFRSRFSVGFQDHKITSTSKIKADSVDRQWILPTHLIPPPVVGAINELHGRLGYSPVGGLEAPMNQLTLRNLPFARVDQLTAALVERVNQVKGACEAFRNVVVRIELSGAVCLEVVPRDAVIRRHAPEKFGSPDVSVGQLTAPATVGKGLTA